MPNNSFLEKVRMANIFQVPRQYEYAEQEPRISPYRQPAIPQQRVQQIGQQMRAPMPEQQPMNVVLGDQGFQSGQEILRQSYGRTSPEFELAKKQLEAQYGFKGQELAIKQQRANAYEYRAKNPNAIIREVGGRMVAIDPISKQTTDLGDSRFMDEADKIALQQEGRVGLEKERQTGRETLLETRGQQEMEQIGARDEETRRTLAADDTRLLPTQQIKQAQHRYNILINRRPELRDYVRLDASGMPDIMPPTKERTGFSRFLGPTKGPTPEQHEEMNQFIFGSSQGSGRTETTTETPPETKTGTVLMKTPDGRILPIPANKVAEAKSRGAVEVTTGVPGQAGVVSREMVPQSNRVFGFYGR